MLVRGHFIGTFLSLINVSELNYTEDKKEIMLILTGHVDTHHRASNLNTKNELPHALWYKSQSWHRQISTTLLSHIQYRSSL